MAVERDPQTLDYARPAETPTKLSAAIYVLATLGGMFVFAATLILFSLLVAVLPLAHWGGEPAVYIAMFLAFILAILAGISSFRGSLRHYRVKRDQVLRRYRMPGR